MQDEAVSAEPTARWRRWLERTLDTRRGGSSHVDALDGIRGLAVAAVFFVHYHPWIGRYLPAGSTRELSARLADVGNAGVDLFFVLSGFLIYGGLLRRHQDFRPFMQRRLQRIYPTFLVVFVPVLLIELARGAPTLSSDAGLVPNLLGNVLLLAGFVPIDPLIVVAWTLSYEIVFYLATPLLFRVFGLRERSPAQRMAIMAAAWGLVALPGVLAEVGNARLLMFLGGVAVAEWVAARRRRIDAGAPDGVLGAHLVRRLGAPLAIAVPVACYLLSYGGRLVAGDEGVPDVAYGDQAWELWVRLAVLLVCLPIVVAAVVDGRGGLAGVTSRRSVRWLGAVSYSYYLIHALVIRFVGEVALAAFDPADHTHGAWWWVALPPVFALTVVAAVVLFAAVERPCSIDPDPPVTVLPPRIVRWPWARARQAA